MRTRRSYRSALETEQVISFMGDKLGIELHPGLTKNFFQILKRYNLE
jgi:HD-GYP domain-containing protein (c-di-GMP phosphodiesterase class II)